MNNQRARVVRDFYADWQQFEGEASRLPQAGMVVRNGFARSYPGAVTGFPLLPQNHPCLPMRRLFF
ncbi:hypothetical protein [Pelotomaculum sp. PtaB.Bin117]|uniref:hypothetical protein n=1 Tax=Pelotomaculum sp. PtaB.Bin117 TaxID=1811694 RepID=UPI0009D18457|nr:hypothetical protein [Pelotomaculum sp. PtaB.Bin117]OPX90154.1 MAG: hypothetical protein A4E54_00728 [Pelotomaculum sp. PtaB.Bin117]